MEVHFTAEQVTFESDESGWVMRIEDTDGFTHIVNIHGCAADLLHAAVRVLGDWAREGEQARAAIERLRGITPTRDEITDAYDATDPKRYALLRDIGEEPGL